MTDFLVELLRFTVGFVLLFSGVLKLRDPRRFISGVAAYRIVSGRAVPLVAVTVMAAEPAAAAGLLGGVLIVGASALAMALGLVFATAIGIALHRRALVTCQCFGGDERVSVLTLVRAALLTATSAVLLLALLSANVRLWTTATFGYAAVGLALAVCVAAWARRPQAPRHVNTHEAAPVALGGAAPSFRFPQNGGPDVNSVELRGRRIVIGVLIPGVAGWDDVVTGLRALAEHIEATPVVVCLGPAVKCPPSSEELRVLCDEQGRILRDLRIKQIPIGIVVDEEWRVSAYGAPTEPGSTRWHLESVPPLRNEVP